MKKKLMVLVLVLALVAALSVGLVACGNKGDGGNGNDTQKVPKTSITADQINASPEQIAKVKIGAIYITSQSDTSGYTYAHNNGIRIAMKDLGIPENAIAIQDNVPEDATAVATAIDTLVGQGCNMIIGISFGYIDAMAAGATEYPGVVFSHATGFKSTDTNFNNYFGRIYQARYLSGIAAGLKCSVGGKIGYVAAYGTDYAETCSGINAFALGVQSVNPTAEILVKTLNTWGNETLERSAAESLIDASGCEIIAQHCDSAQPQLVAAEKGKFGCGYNSDMTKQAPNGHLTAPIWNWNIYYAAAIKSAALALDKANGGNVTDYVKTIGGAWYGGLKENFVDVSPLSQNCSAGTADAIAKVKAMMIAWQTDTNDVNGFDVFGGYKLNITINGNTASVQKNEADLKKNDGSVVIPAKGNYISDGVICGSMNYFVAGVKLVNA